MLLPTSSSIYIRFEYSTRIEVSTSIPEFEGFSKLPAFSLNLTEIYSLNQRIIFFHELFLDYIPLYHLLYFIFIHPLGNFDRYLLHKIKLSAKYKLLSCSAVFWVDLQNSFRQLTSPPRNKMYFSTFRVSYNNLSQVAKY